MARKAKYLTDAATFNKEYERLVQLRTEIKNRLSEVSSLIIKLEENKDLPSEVEDTLESLKERSSELDTTVTTAETNATQIQSYYDNWAAIKQKIDNEFKTAKNQNSTIASYISEAESLKEKYDEEMVRADDLLKEARQTLDIVSNNAVASFYQKRSNNRMRSRRWWALFVALAIIMLGAAVIYSVENVANDIANESQFGVWVLKLGIISPFAYVLYFVGKQYNHERDLEEKYLFKSLIAQTIRNNTKLLRDEFIGEDEKNTDVETKILDFVISSMQSVYSEPYGKSKTESKIKFNPRNTQIEAEARQSESV